MITFLFFKFLKFYFRYIFSFDDIFILVSRVHCVNDGATEVNMLWEISVLTPNYSDREIFVISDLLSLGHLIQSAQVWVFSCSLYYTRSMN